MSWEIPDKVIILAPGKSPDLMAGNPGWPRKGLLGAPTKGFGGPPVPFRWMGACPVCKALARSSKNISSCELAECPPPPEDDDYLVRMIGLSVSGDLDDDDGDGDDDDGDDEPAGWPAVWEKGFKPPPDSSFMFLK